MNLLAGMSAVGLLIGGWLISKPSKYTMDGVEIPSSVYEGEEGDTLSKWAPAAEMLNTERVLYMVRISTKYGTLTGVVEDDIHYFVLTNKRFIKIFNDRIEMAIPLSAITTISSHHNEIILTHVVETPTGSILSLRFNLIRSSVADFFRNRIQQFISNTTNPIITSKL